LHDGDPRSLYSYSIEYCTNDRIDWTKKAMATNLKKTLFISDLHLDESHPTILDAFLKLLNQCDSSIEALYILGDLFQAWIGDDDDTPFHRQVIDALRATTQKGIPIYFMHGNRDFLIGKRFLQATGCRLLTEEETISLYGTRVLLMHGDSLCTRDVEYLKWRKIALHPFFQWLANASPLKLRRYVANKLRASSMQHTKRVNKEIMDVTHEEVIRVLQKHQSLFLIHGHTHKPGIHEFPLESKMATRIVLDAWHEKGNMLAWDSEGNKKLEWFA
jgi:UDP-2,3-diacylglucosamine hydrolase